MSAAAHCVCQTARRYALLLALTAEAECYVQPELKVSTPALTQNTQAGVLIWNLGGHHGCVVQDAELAPPRKNRDRLRHGRHLCKTLLTHSRYSPEETTQKKHKQI